MSELLTFGWSVEFEGISLIVPLVVIGSVLYTFYRAIRHIALLTLDVSRELRRLTDKERAKSQS